MKQKIDENNTMQQAINDLKNLILNHYPEAFFEVSPSPEDSEVIHLYATVDVVDSDEVLDSVIDRVFYYQDKGHPLHVIVRRTPEREAEVFKANHTDFPSFIFSPLNL
jgi:hypothetical protein